MATCTQCGAELKPGTKFCENCGAKISVPQPAAQPAAVRPSQPQPQDCSRRQAAIPMQAAQTPPQPQTNAANPYAGNAPGTPPQTGAGAPLYARKTPPPASTPPDAHAAAAAAARARA